MVFIRLICLAGVSAAGFGQAFEVKPPAVRQGETLHLRGPAAAARMEGRTVRLFPQVEGGRLGLMPVPVRTTPGEREIEFIDDAGAVLHTAAVVVRDARFPRQNIVIGREKKELKPSPGEMETVAALRRTVTETRFWSEPFAAPVAGCMNSPFGVQRWHNGKPTGSFHGGVDLRSPAGTPVRAAAAGVVQFGRMFNIHGGTVGIDHGQGVTTVYLHMSKLAAADGRRVGKGDVIGYVGSTGFSTGPHLHWVVNVNGVPVNPRQWAALKPCATAKKRSR